MKIISAMASAAILSFALSACVSDGGGSTATTQNAITPFIGKTLVGNGGSFIFNANGTVGGQFKGEQVVGTYTATANESCSTYTAPKQLTGREFCSTPIISGNTVVFKRRDGSNSSVFKIEG